MDNIDCSADILCANLGWLITNSNFVSHVSWAFCTNGTRLKDLNASVYCSSTSKNSLTPRKHTKFL